MKKKGTLKLIKSINCSSNALFAMMKGKYFASQIKLVDWSGSELDKRKKENKRLHEVFTKDLKACAVKSSHPNSIGGLEWHHIDKSSRSYMVFVDKLKKRGWEITGNPNKELKIRRR